MSDAAFHRADQDFAAAELVYREAAGLHGSGTPEAEAAWQTMQRAGAQLRRLPEAK